MGNQLVNEIFIIVNSNNKNYFKISRVLQFFIFVIKGSANQLYSDLFPQMESQKIQSSHKILSVLRKQKFQSKSIIHRSEGAVITMQSQNSRSMKEQTQIYKPIFGTVNNYHALIDSTEIEDLDMVFKQVKAAQTQPWRVQQRIEQVKGEEEKQKKQMLFEGNMGQVRENYLQQKQSERKRERMINQMKLKGYKPMEENVQLDEGDQKILDYLGDSYKTQNIGQTDQKHIVLQLLDYEQKKPILNRESNNCEYKHRIARSLHDVKHIKAGNSSAVVDRSFSNFSRTNLNWSNIIEPQENLDSFYLTDGFARKSMISMKTNQPIIPYVKLLSLAEQIAGTKNGKLLSENQQKIDLALEKLEEFKNFDFTSESQKLQNEKRLQELHSTNKVRQSDQSSKMKKVTEKIMISSLLSRPQSEKVSPNQSPSPLSQSNYHFKTPSPDQEIPGFMQQHHQGQGNVIALQNIQSLAGINNTSPLVAHLLQNTSHQNQNSPEFQDFAPIDGKAEKLANLNKENILLKNCAQDEVFDVLLQDDSPLKDKLITNSSKDNQITQNTKQQMNQAQNQTQSNNNQIQISIKDKLNRRQQLQDALQEKDKDQNKINPLLYKRKRRDYSTDKNLRYQHETSPEKIIEEMLKNPYIDSQQAEVIKKKMSDPHANKRSQNQLSSPNLESSRLKPEPAVPDTYLRDMEESKARQFCNLVQMSEKRESRLLAGCQNFITLQRDQNSYLLNHIKTVERDRPVTQQIRRSQYRPDVVQKENTLYKIRNRAEQERKKRIVPLESQIKWYEKLLDRVARFCDPKEDITVCHLMMNEIQSILEDTYLVQQHHIVNILEIVESDNSLIYTPTSFIMLVEIFKFFQFQPEQIFVFHQYREMNQQFTRTNLEQKGCGAAANQNKNQQDNTITTGTLSTQ